MMKGAAAVALVIAALFLSGIASGSQPLKEPIQYEQLCNNLKIAGNDTIDISASLMDKRIALVYYNALSGAGRVEMDQERIHSQAGRKITKDTPSANRSNSSSQSSNQNFFENSKVASSGRNPLAGEKYLLSRQFYGGIGALVEDTFSVNQLVEDQKTTFGSMTSATGAHLIGEDTRGAFNGSWQTGASWHKLFYKDLRSHQSLSGN